jgi:hypothetical protein
LTYLTRWIGKNEGIDKANDIWHEYETKVREAIEGNDAIYEACKKLEPIHEELPKTNIQTLKRIN